MKLFSDRRRVVRLGTGLALLLILGLVLWFFWPNPHIARAEALRDQLGQEGLTSEQRGELFGRLRQEMRKIPAEERANLWREQRQKQMEAYRGLSDKEKKAYLDRMIDRMQQWRQQMQANGNTLNGPQAGWRRLSQEERDQRRKARLDWTTPEDRAERAQFRHDLQVRMQQRGFGGGGWPGRW